MDLNTLNLDPDPEVWPNFDLDTYMVMLLILREKKNKIILEKDNFLF